MNFVRNAIERYGSPITALRAISVISIVESLFSILRILRQFLLLFPESIAFHLTTILRNSCTILAMVILFRMVVGWKVKRIVKARSAVLFLLILSVIPISMGVYSLVRPFFWGPSLYEILIMSPHEVATYVFQVLAGVFLIVTAGELSKFSDEDLVFPRLVMTGGRNFLISIILWALASIIQHISSIPYMIKHFIESEPYPFILPSVIAVLLAGVLLAYAALRLLRNDLRLDGGFTKSIGLTCITRGMGILLYLPVSLPSLLFALRTKLTIDLVVMVIRSGLSIPLLIIYILLGLHLYFRETHKLDLRCE